MSENTKQIDKLMHPFGTRCYRCHNILRDAAHRLGLLWFCSKCWYRMEDATKLGYRYLEQPPLVDEDTIRKDNLIEE